MEILAIFTKMAKFLLEKKNMTSKESRFWGRNFENFSKFFFSRKQALNCEQLLFWTFFHISHRFLSKVHFSNKFEKCYSETKKNFEVEELFSTHVYQRFWHIFVGKKTAPFRTPKSTYKCYFETVYHCTKVYYSTMVYYINHLVWKITFWAK